MVTSPYKIIPSNVEPPLGGGWSSRNVLKVVIPLCILNILYAFMGTSIIHTSWFPSTPIIATTPPTVSNRSRCEFKELDPFGKDMKPFLRRDWSVKCDERYGLEKPAFVQERGKRILKRVHPFAGKCCYKPFTGPDKCIQIPATENVTHILLKPEFVNIELFCEDQQGYKDGFVFIDVDQEKTPKNSKQEDKINVVVLGLDNTSRLQFLRALPKSNKFLINNLSAIVMKGYTKVADNSLPNLLPVLTGRSLKEFQKECAENEHSHLDDCPFIWKEYKKKGFKTGFAEDATGIAIFNLNWANPFTKPPTDFYMRPFSKFMETHMMHGQGFCYGTRLSFKTLLDNLENTAAALHPLNQPYFHFTWTTKLSHDGFNRMHTADEPLLNFLEYMHNSHHLNHTVLIILGDHGNRAPPPAQMNPQGKVEVRMPVLYFVLPKWFSTKYPEAYQNLKENSDKLTSPYDVYATLQQLLDQESLHNANKEENKKSEEEESLERKPISFFRKVPVYRTCLEAGVSLHWCTCKGTRDEDPVSIKTKDVKKAVQLSIDFINNHLKPVKNQCAELKLNEIVSAFNLPYAPTQYSSPSSKGLRLYFKTKPGLGYFSSTVASVNGSWFVVDQVPRLDHYGEQSRCVVQEYKFYCYCE